jgi:hypothetical protein
LCSAGNEAGSGFALYGEAMESRAGMIDFYQWISG